MQVTKLAPIPQKVEALVNTVVDATGLQSFGAYLTLLLECDMLILNEDRHLNNIAVVRAARALYGRQLVLPAQLTDFYQAAEDSAQEYPKLYQSYLKERVCSVAELQRKKL